MDKLIKQNSQLPSTIDDLAKFILIGREKLTAVKAGIRAIEKLDLAKEVREQKKEEAQDLAGALLDAEVRIGQLLKALPRVGGQRTDLEPGNTAVTRFQNNENTTSKQPEHAGATRLNQTTKQESIKKLGFDKMQASRFETLAEHPDIVEEVKAEARKNDDLPTRTEVLHRIRDKQKETELADIKKKPCRKMDGLYDVVVIDPPWPMEKIERECRPNQTKSLDYPVMTEEELKNFKLPMASNCHVWLWTTHKFLPMAFRLLDHWQLRYVCCFTWHKPGGFQPYGLPQYNSEFALYAKFGTPSFVDTKAFNTCFNAERGKHSEKPTVFYDTIRRVTDGRRVDIFNRRGIDGFDVYGNQA